jgi:hypothetical protein
MSDRFRLVTTSPIIQAHTIDTAKSKRTPSSTLISLRAVHIGHGVTSSLPLVCAVGA